MTLATPGVFVEASPTLTPPRYGLMSAAAILAESDPHSKNGVHYLPNPSGVLGYLDPNCPTEDGDPIPEPEFENGLDWHSAPPIYVYWGFTCKAVGLEQQVLDARVRARLNGGESPALESAIWLGGTMDDVDGVSRKFGLLDDDTQIQGGAAVPLARGVGILERFMWENYAGTPVLHIAREFYPALSDARLLEVNAGKATTPVGSTWSLGAYPNTSKAGAVAPAGQAWIVASGQVEIARHEPIIRGNEYTSGQGVGFSPRTNEVFMLGYRTENVRWDGVTAAVLVTL